MTPLFGKSLNLIICFKQLKLSLKAKGNAINIKVFFIKTEPLGHIHYETSTTSCEHKDIGSQG